MTSSWNPMDITIRSRRSAIPITTALPARSPIAGKSLVMTGKEIRSRPVLLIHSAPAPAAKKERTKVHQDTPFICRRVIGPIFRPLIRFVRYTAGLCITASSFTFL